MAKKQIKAAPKVTALSIAREYFPNKRKMSDKHLNDLIWGHTGYPHFWNIPHDGNTPEECFRKQLKQIQDDFAAWDKLTVKEKMARICREQEEMSRSLDELRSRESKDASEGVRKVRRSPQKRRVRKQV